MYQKGQYSKAFTKSGLTLKSSQKMAVATNCKQFLSTVLQHLTAKYKSAKVRKKSTCYLSKCINTNTTCGTIQNQSRQTKHEEMECSNSLDNFVSAQKKKKRKDSWSCSSQQKGKGIGQCIKRQARHAVDGNRSWFGHLA